MSSSFSIGVLGIAGLAGRGDELLVGGTRFGVEDPDFLVVFLPRLRFFFEDISLFVTISISSSLTEFSSSPYFGGRSDFMQKTSDWHLIPTSRRGIRSSLRARPLYRSLM